MEKRLAAEKADVTNVARMQDIEGASELIGIDPAQIAGWYLAAREIAEVATSVAGVRHCDIAERGAATTD
jgi:hypothetical protein